MKYWAVTHQHTEWVEAETEIDALESAAESVRDNAKANDCAAVEVSKEGYDQHWREVIG